VTATAIALPAWWLGGEKWYTTLCPYAGQVLLSRDPVPHDRFWLAIDGNWEFFMANITRQEGEENRERYTARYFLGNKEVYREPLDAYLQRVPAVHRPTVVRNQT
jgi:hypothetical protein